ncbi:Hsp20/alpha crystallin family protein [Candidatus Binatia bacterium]|nr:Hsp20/alpha crystallin family protein [Candidatus Binatia bacterium]
MAMFRFDLLDPGSGLVALQRELERVFENPPFNFGISGRGVFPAINAFSDKEGLVLRVEVPGVAADTLRIEAQGRTLTISGERRRSGPEGASYHRRERNVGTFSRSLQLPEDTDASRASAAYKHGILSVRIPRREEAKPRQIAVRAG